MENLWGIALKICSALLFTLMSAMIKWLGGAFPTGEIVFVRSFFALIPLLAWIGLRGDFRGELKTENVIGHFWRGFVGCISMFASFACLAYLPLPDATAIGYASPLMTVALAAIVLKEEVRIYRWSAVVIGLCGVFVMLWPHIGSGAAADGSARGAGLALLGATGAAMAMTLVRRLTRTERVSAIVFYFSVFSSLIGLATFPLGWIAPTGREALLFVGIGLVGGIAQIFLTQAYRMATASLVAPFDYTTMLWSVLLGYWMFGDVPSAYVLAGAAVVIAAGVFVIWRERQLGLERSRARKARTPTVV